MPITYRRRSIILALAIVLLVAALASATITSPGAGQTMLSYTVSNATALRIADAFAWAHNYQPVVGGAANPESKAQFADRMIAEHIRSTVRQYELVKAREAAEAVEAAKPAITVQ